ncbi:MAG: YbjN domain-containing protein [Sphingomonas sp.]
MWVRALAFVAALTLPASAMAADRVVDVSSVQGVATLLKDAGYKAEIKMGKDGTSYIVSGVNGSSFNIDFYGCTNDKGCTSIDFYSWDKKEAFFSPALANEWNASKRFLKVAIDKDGDLSEYLSVSTLGNMTLDNFKDYIDWFASMEGDLAKFLAEKRGK